MSSSSLPVSGSASSPRFRALPTEYQGITFRSRLEARWAVFFDSIGVTWCYEDEGYELSDGTFYLPDFYIPRWDCNIEIKSTAQPDEKVKCAVLCECLQRKVLLVEGFTDYQKYHVTRFSPGPGPDYCPANCRFGIDRKDESAYYLVGEECACHLDIPIIESDKYPLTDEWARAIMEAYAKACHFWTDYRSNR